MPLVYIPEYEAWAPEGVAWQAAGGGTSSPPHSVQYSFS